MASNLTNIKMLQKALNTKGGRRIMYSTTEFYSEQQDRPITTYHIKEAVWDNDKGRYQNQPLFKSTSQIEVVLFLRDLWYSVNGREIPQNNEVWNAKKARYKGE